MLQMWREKGIMPLNVPQRKRERKSCESHGVTPYQISQVKNSQMKVRIAPILLPLCLESLRILSRKKP